MMALRVLVAVFLFCPPLLSQIFVQKVPAPIPPPAPAACGDLRAKMAVDFGGSQHVIAQPEPGKALIYFIHDNGGAIEHFHPVTEIGIDGKWVGANQGSSYFFVVVEPGEHHLCAAGRGLELAHLTAEAGKTYYYRTLLSTSYGDLARYFSLTPVDSDEAKYLIESFPLATAHARR